MKAIEQLPRAVVTSSDRELFLLELRVARRADELSRLTTGDHLNRDRDLLSWYQAESEVLVHREAGEAVPPS